MVIAYSVVLAIAGLLQAIALQLAPELALGVDVFAILVGYLLIKLGVEVVGIPAAAYFARRFKALKRFAPKH